VLSEVISILRQQVNYNEFENKPDNKLAIPQLRNMILFYYEKGGFNPYKHLPYIAVMEKTYNKKPPTVDEDITDDTWKSYRNAYKVP
ncbi:MAG: hypothetical protein WCF67_01555, partial [Chitinophagaceae bacterium]